MTEDNESVDLIQDIRQKLLAVAINLLVIIELFIAMYHASGNQEEFTPRFFTMFFSLLLPTLVLGWLTKRYLSLKRNKTLMTIADISPISDKEHQLTGATANNNGR